MKTLGQPKTRLKEENLGFFFNSFFLVGGGGGSARAAYFGGLTTSLPRNLLRTLT